MSLRSEIEASDLDDDFSVTPEQNETPNEQEAMEVQGKCRIYRFRMHHFFYIQVVIFTVIGLLAGLMIYLIENYSAIKNRQIEVSYINAWFIACTCICGCGLTTLVFAKLSLASQILLLVFTTICGLTMGTLPVLAIKAYTHKHIEGITVDTDHGKEIQNSADNHQNSTSATTNRRLPPELERKFALLLTPQQIRFWAYITIIVLIILTCTFLYLFFFVILGAWLDARYSENGLAEGNVTVSPWYTSIVIVTTGFNQNGLTPFSDGMARFVNDVYMNIFVMMIVLSGTSLFPVLLRNVVLLSRLLVPWRYKIVCDYILLNHHHVSTLLFPTLQTRIYLSITFFLHVVAISISLILDLHNSYLAQFTPGTRLLIFVFHTVNARFAGFQTIDISYFTSATLIIYLLLMITKPQMLCALSKSRFELTWISLQENQKETEQQQQPDSLPPNTVDNLSVLRRRTSSKNSNEAFVERHVNLSFSRHRSATKELVRKAKSSENDNQKRRQVSHLYFRLFLLKFAQAIFKHTMYTLGQTRTWLCIFIFLICAIEQERIAVDPNVTVFKVVFEVVSAFGCVGLTLGYPGVSSSFATILSPTSRVIVGLTMLLGRHRGLLASMKDQEEIEHSANDLLKKWKEKTISQYDISVKDEVTFVRL